MLDIAIVSDVFVNMCHCKLDLFRFGVVEFRWQRQKFLLLIERERVIKFVLFLLHYFDIQTFQKEILQLHFPKKFRNFFISNVEYCRSVELTKPKVRCRSSTKPLHTIQNNFWKYLKKFDILPLLTNN